MGKAAIISVLLAVVTAGVALTFQDRTSDLQKRIAVLKVRKAIFAAKSDEVIKAVAVPMIAEVNDLILESQRIQDEAKAIASDVNMPDVTTKLFLEVTENACDPNSIQDKKNTLELLKFIIDIAREELTR
jgi:hypothetical protein